MWLLFEVCLKPLYRVCSHWRLIIAHPADGCHLCPHMIQLLLGADFSNVFLSVRTANQYHVSRLKILLDTWISLYPSSTWIFTGMTQVRNVLLGKTIQVYLSHADPRPKISSLLIASHSTLGIGYMKRSINNAGTRTTWPIVFRLNHTNLHHLRAMISALSRCPYGFSSILISMSIQLRSVDGAQYDCAWRSGRFYVNRGTKVVC